jgi:hypothetical protein
VEANPTRAAFRAAAAGTQAPLEEATTAHRIPGMPPPWPDPPRWGPPMASTAAPGLLSRSGSGAGTALQPGPCPLLSRRWVPCS